MGYQRLNLHVQAFAETACSVACLGRPTAAFLQSAASGALLAGVSVQSLWRATRRTFGEDPAVPQVSVSRSIGLPRFCTWSLAGDDTVAHRALRHYNIPAVTLQLAQWLL